MPSANYFRYFAVGPDMRRWGLALTGCGYTKVKPREHYPSGLHPSDHLFDWERGRVIDAMQIVFVESGAGWFESESIGCREVGAGAAFVILPGVWHRYRPNPVTGWTESWIEVMGPVVENLIGSGAFLTTTCFRPLEPGADLAAALEGLHWRARCAEPGFDPEAAAAALAVLAAWEKVRPVLPGRSRLLRAVRAAESFLHDHMNETVNIAELARQQGVAYSHFRRAFKAHTGYAPWQYVLHLRITQARRLMAGSDITLAEVGDRLGFSSAFHFSTAFKRACGVAPDHWRRSLLERVPGAPGGLVATNAPARVTRRHR